jgi:hypothetical protein
MRAFWIGALYAAGATLIGLVALFWYGLGMPDRSYDGPLPQATREEEDLAALLRRHVVAVAGAPHNMRHDDNLEYDSYLDAPGANDNGSGVAALLQLARLLKDLRPRRTWDLFERVAVVPADQAFRSIKDAGCPPVKGRP